MCHLMHLATSWTSLLLVIELAASPRFLVESYPTFVEYDVIPSTSNLHVPAWILLWSFHLSPSSVLAPFQA